MPEAVHPGSFVGDSVEEFRKLPTWGKVAAVAVVGVVIYLAIRARNAASTTNSTGMTGTPSTSPTQQGLPSFPYGTTALNDANGNPIGTIQPPPPTPPPPPPPPPGTPPPPPPPPPPSQNPSSPFSSLPAGFRDVLGFVTNINGVNYSIVPGSQGRIWAIEGTGFTQQQLLNTPIGPQIGQKFLFYQQPNWQPLTTNLMSNNSTGNATHYTQNAVPHVTNTYNAPGTQYKPVTVSTSGPIAVQGGSGDFGQQTKVPANVR